MSNKSIKRNKIHIKKGDIVIVITGENKGKRGEVLRAYPQENKVLVQGVNLVKKHARRSQKFPQGGIQEREAAISASNVMIFCPSCNQPTRIKRNFIESGDKVRICKKCGEILDR